MTNTEQLLLSFGPFGVSVCEGPYAIFKWHWRNVFRIDLTDRCLYGRRLSRIRIIRRPRGGAPFEIPYTSIISATIAPHPARLGLQKIIDVTYHDAEGVREKSIAAYNRPAEGAFAILRHFLPRTGGATGRLLD